MKMKTINKIVSGFAMVALLASCAEKQLPDSAAIPAGGSQSDAVVPTEIVATFEETKVTYSEIDAGLVVNLRPTWEVGDEIIALGEDGANYKLTVKTVTGDKSAILGGEVPANCSLHLIYCPGISATAAGTEGLTLPINMDYTAQTGAQKTTPAAMFSDGEVVKGAGNFTFRNAGAIIGISAVNGAPKDSKVTKITVSGENLSAATIALSGSALTLTATENADDAISVDGLDLTVTDSYGTLSTPVLIAVPAGAKIAKVTVSITKEPETMKKPSATPREGVDYVTIAGKKWAKWNIGASENSKNPEAEYGWYFAWGDTNGYVYKNISQFVSASAKDEYTYSPSTVYTVEANTYVYVKKRFNGHSFDCRHTPYQTQNIEDLDHVKFIKYLGSTSSRDKDPSATDEDALKTVLDPEDDAAHVLWGGNWRMPTYLEIKHLFFHTTRKGERHGFLLTSTEPGEENHTIFLPHSGYASDMSMYSYGDAGYIWSSSLHYDGYDSVWSDVLRFWLAGDDAFVLDVGSRSSGIPIRPVLDE